MNRKIGLGAILVVLIGISIYMWTAQTEIEIDQNIDAFVESHTCPHCNHQFDLTIAEQRNMLRSEHDIICPECGKGGSQKDVVIATGSGGFSTRGDDIDEEDQEDEEERPPVPVGGMNPRP